MEKIIITYLEVALIHSVYYFHLQFSLGRFTSPEQVSADQSYHETVGFAPISPSPD